jgi:hypothetical protein
MEDLFIKSLPKLIKIVNKSNPQLITVYRRGNIFESPKDNFKVYIPENNKYDIPRSFVTYLTNNITFIYREYVSIDLITKQRPIIIKYMIELYNKNTYLIFLITKNADIRAKHDEIEIYIETLKEEQIKISGIIIIININLKDNIKNIKWPLKPFIIFYEE